MLCFALAAAMIGTHGRTELSLTGLAAWSVSVDLAVRYQGSEVLGCCRVTAHRRGAQLRMGRRFYRGWPHLLVAALAMVATMPSRTFGEDVAAAVVLHDGAEADVEALRGFVASRVAAFKVPRKIVFLEEIPKGPTGKLQRIGLAQRLHVED